MPNNANSSSDFAGVNIAMMTVSDSHTEETDSSGKLRFWRSASPKPVTVIEIEIMPRLKAR